MFSEKKTGIHQALDSLCTMERASWGTGSSWPWGELSQGDVQTNVTGRAPVSSIWHKKNEPVSASSLRSGGRFQRKLPHCAHAQSSGSHHSTWPERVGSMGGALDEHTPCFPPPWAPDQIKPNIHRVNRRFWHQLSHFAYLLLPRHAACWFRHSHGR